MIPPSVIHAEVYGKAPMPAGLLHPMRTRTSLPILLRKGWVAEPLLDVNWDRICSKGSDGSGAAIIALDGFCGLDKARVKGLLESSFGKTLAAGYFDKPAGMVYLAGDYQGIAVIKTLGRFDYLDKLAVAPQARGEGLGRELWENIKKDFPSLIWRAAPDNPANAWYLRNSDGAARSGKWMVYWYGIEPNAVNAIIPLVAALPPTLAHGIHQDQGRM